MDYSSNEKERQRSVSHPPEDSQMEASRKQDASIWDNLYSMVKNIYITNRIKI